MTWGLRWWKGYYHLHIMWMQYSPPHHWRSTRLRDRYLSISSALNQLKDLDNQVMIFPV